MKNELCSLRWLLFVVILMSACQEDLVSTVAVDPGEVRAPQPPYPFAWETLEFMPTPPGKTIRVPWSNSVNILYDPVIRYDFKKVDGWKLLYNTFNTTNYTNGEFFALYNIYRGVIRYYTYIEPNSPTASSYLEDICVATSTTGQTTSFFNFVGKEVVDPTANTLTARQLKPFPLPSEGGWYVAQYEIAYDKNLTNLYYTDLSLLQSLKFYQITNTVLSGTVTGTGQGTVQTPSGTFDTYFQNAGKIVTAVVLEDPIFSWPSYVTESLKKVKEEGAAGVIKGIANLVSSPITAGGPQQINFTFGANVMLNGTSTATGNVKSNFTIAMPGTSNATSGIGPVPADNKPLGIFNFTSRPVVSVKNQLITPLQCLAPYGMTSSAYEYTFYLDNTFLSSLVPGAVNQVYNPYALDSANVSIGYFYNWTGWTPPTPRLEILVGTLNPAISNGIQVVGKTDCNFIPDETIDGVLMKNITPARNGASSGVVGNGMFRNDTPVYLRITFDVVPDNGAPRTTIVKTFKCNISSWV